VNSVYHLNFSETYDHLATHDKDNFPPSGRSSGNINIVWNLKMPLNLQASSLWLHCKFFMVKPHNDWTNRSLNTLYI